MKIIEPSVELITTDNLHKIELAGRCCYASEDKICEGSAEQFFKKMIERKHFSPMEHSNIVVRTNTDEATVHMLNLINEYESVTGIPSYIRRYGSSNENAEFCDNIWSGNVRSWRNICNEYRSEIILRLLFSYNSMFEDIFDKPLCRHYYYYDRYEDAEIIPADPLNRPRHKIATFRVETSRAVADELFRHRLNGVSCQSQRYIDFSNLPVCKPWFYSEMSEEQIDRINGMFIDSEQDYMRVAEIYGSKQNQRCRIVLPMQTLTKFYSTATIEVWNNFVLPLRCSNAAYPDMRIIANMIKEVIDNEQH